MSSDVENRCIDWLANIDDSDYFHAYTPLEFLLDFILS